MQNNLKLIARHVPLLIIINALCGIMGPVSRAGLALPYAADVNTLHLWPMNSTNNMQSLDSQTANPQTPTFPLFLWPGPTNAVYGAANGGTAPTDFPALVPGEFPALGNATHFTANCGAYVPFVVATNSDGTTNFTGGNNGGVYQVNTNISCYINTNTGAFTWEAVIRPDNNLLTGAGGSIIGGDSGFGNRAWQWNIGGGNWSLLMDIGTVQTFITIPLTNSGPDVPVAGRWYHVAVTSTGDAPTNGDTPKVLKFYWTLLNPHNTNAHVMYTGVMTNRPTGFAPVCVSGSCRQAGGGKSVWNQSAATAGFQGAMQQVRMSAACLHADQMAFNSTLNPLPTAIVLQPPATALVGEGRTLNINCAALAAPDPWYQWYQGATLLTGQTNSTLVISNLTFAGAGSYTCTITNTLLSTNTTACVVTVGADIPGLYNTGVGNGINPDNSNPPLDQTAPGSVDLHWLLVQTTDPFATLPNCIVWGDALPNAETLNGASVWIAPELYYGTANGNAAVVGAEDFREIFYINQGDVNTAIVSGTVQTAGATGGAGFQIFINGTENDFTTSANPLTVAVPFSFTTVNGLVEGSNSIDFVYPTTAGGAAVAMKVNISGICTNALAAGLPIISNQPPISQTVPYGSTVTVPFCAVGRPPLSYQWYSNNVAIPGANSQTLTFVATNFDVTAAVGGQFTANYSMIVSNDSGPVTSSTDIITIQVPSTSVAAAGLPIWYSTGTESNIIVTFTGGAGGAVDPATATTLANYALDNGASVLSATMGDTPNKVILGTSILTPGASYTLTVSGVNDAFGDAVTPSPANLVVGVYPAATALWIKANTGVTTDGSGNVTGWSDLSGNANNLVPFGVPNEPQLAVNSFNGYPVVRFNPTNNSFMYAADSASLEITNDMTVFALMRYSTLAGGTNGMIVSKTDAGTGRIPAPYDYYANAPSAAGLSTSSLLRGNGTQSGSVASSQTISTAFPQLLDVVMQGPNVTQKLDGNANGTGIFNKATIQIADAAQPLCIGTRSDLQNHLSGDMAELILIGSALSSNDVALIENYLAAEYNVPTLTNTYPAITQQPVTNTTVSQGSTLSVPAAATGNPAVAYQWYRTNNVAVAGQTTATLTIPGILTNETYYLQVSNRYGVLNSGYVVVTVNAGLNVSVAPSAAVTLYAGQGVPLTVTASGTVPFHYQWYQGASLIPNATNASYTAVATLGAVNYSCTVTNAYLGYSTATAGPVPLTGIAAPTNLYQATVLAGHPIAFWQLSEGPDNGSGNNGTIAYDYVGGNNGFYTNAVIGLPGFSSLSSTDTAALFGQVKSTNCFVQTLGTNVDFSSASNGGFTIVLWANSYTNKTQTANAGLVSKGYSANEEYFLDEGATGSALRWGVRLPANTVVSINSSVKLTNDPNWHLLVGVCDELNTNLAFYIDGQLIGQTFNVGLAAGLYKPGAINPLEIGARGTAALVGEWQFGGLIDDVAVYNYAMTASQVIAAYDAGAKNAVFSTVPTNITLSATATNLNMSWPVDHWGWHLQAQTNNLAGGLGANWVNVVNSSSTNQVMVPILRTNGSVFYRLVYP